MPRIVAHLLLSLAVTSGLEAFAQTIGQTKSADAPTFTLSVRSQLVIESVVVKDKSGNLVHGLNAKDFRLTEEGVMQEIRVFDHQSLSAGTEPLPPRSKDEEQLTVYGRLARGQIAGEKFESPKYKDRRLITLYFDLSTMMPSDQHRAFAAAEHFVRERLTAVDLVSIMRYDGGAVDVLADFSADRNRLLSILRTLSIGEGRGGIETSQDAGTADTGAAFGQDDAEFNVFNTDRQLAALQTATKMLSSLNEKKALVYFAGGMRLNGSDNQAQLHSTIDSAIRAGVSFWPVDTRGLVAEAPMGDASQGSPGGQAMYTGATEQTMQSNLAQSQDTLYALASDTGGKAFLDNNDLELGIRNAQASISDYYILGYYTSNKTLDGRFRRVKIAINNPDWKLEYRQGYYAGKEFEKFTAADKERQLEDALMLEDPITELTLAVELNYFQLNHAEYFVPITVKIPGRELAMAKKGGAEHTLIDFIGEIKEAVAGTTVTNVRDNVNIKLTNATALQLAQKPIEYDTGFTLLPGRYTIKLLARDDETGRIGTYQTSFTIPNLNTQGVRVPISSVVLSSQRVDLNDALYSAQKGKNIAKDTAVNPLVSDNQILIPSVTRAFSKKRPLFVYLQAYENAGESNEPLVGFVSLYKGGIKLLDSNRVAVTPLPSTRLTPVPMTFGLSLEHLSEGDYDLQVSVLAPQSKRTQFWRGIITVLP